MDSLNIYLIFIIPLALVFFYYLSNHNKRKLTDAGMTTFGGFWKSFFKVTGVPAAIIGYVIFSHERDEKIKEFVNNDIHSKIYGNSANKSNSSKDSSPTQENSIQPMVLQSEPDSNDATDRVKEFITLGKQGNADAQLKLGLIYYHGEGVATDYGQAFSWYREAAEQGNADAQWRLGVMYYKGEGVTKDYGQAINWFRKGAEQGSADAQWRLGYTYNRGEGVTKNYSQAVSWYRKAAEQGSANAQWMLGLMYYLGHGVAKDYGQAVSWYRKAAEQGNADAQKGLAIMYNRGEGVAKDYAQAAILYRKAAEQGNTDAQVNLSLMYYRGEGVVQDYAQAFDWNRKAAEQGNSQGQANLAAMYDNEIGVSKNEILAYVLYSLASVNDENYVSLRDSMANKLAPDQLAEAQKLAVNWKVGTPLPTTTKINRKLKYELQ